VRVVAVAAYIETGAVSVTLVGNTYARTVTAADPVTRNGPCASVGLIVRAYT
jgi:hypothetical protein